MSSPPPSRQQNGTDHSPTSDSETYSANNELSSSPSAPSSSDNSSPIILYKPPTIWTLIRGAAINLLLPFVNGLMLGFGELLAHEAAFRLGWSGTKVSTTLRFTCHATGALDILSGWTGRVYGVTIQGIWGLIDW